MEIIRKIIVQNKNKNKKSGEATFFLTKINGIYWWKWDVNYDIRKNLIKLYIEEGRDYRDLYFRFTTNWRNCYHLEFKEEDLNE